MAQGFGDNQAAKVLEEVTQYVNIRDGTVQSSPQGNGSSNEESEFLTITCTIGSFRLTQASRLTAKAIAITDHDVQILKARQ